MSFTADDDFSVRKDAAALMVGVAKQASNDPVVLLEAAPKLVIEVAALLKSEKYTSVSDIGKAVR